MPKISTTRKSVQKYKKMDLFGLVRQVFSEEKSDEFARLLLNYEELQNQRQRIRIEINEYIEKNFRKDLPPKALKRMKEKVQKMELVSKRILVELDIEDLEKQIYNLVEKNEKKESKKRKRQPVGTSKESTSKRVCKEISKNIPENTGTNWKKSNHQPLISTFLSKKKVDDKIPSEVRRNIHPNLQDLIVTLCCKIFMDYVVNK